MTNSPSLHRDEYRDERKLLIDAKREGARTFDKGILTLSAAALGLSLTLLRNQTHVDSRRALFAAWGGFILSILLTLVSQLTSQSEIDHLLDTLDATQSPGEGRPRQRAVGRLTVRLNWLSITFFIVGVIALALFSATLLS